MPQYTCYYYNITLFVYQIAITVNNVAKQNTTTLYIDMSPKAHTSVELQMCVKILDNVLLYQTMSV